MKEPTENRVYFAHRAGGGAIKVGFSSRLELRIRSLAVLTHERVELITSIPGTRTRESWLLAALAPWQLHGEVFRSCVPIWRVITEASETGDISWLPVTESGGRSFQRALAQQSFQRALAEGALPPWLSAAHEAVVAARAAA